MCNKCKKPALEIGLHSEAWAMKGCAKLWQTWCRQNAELVEEETVKWLYDNSQCLRIMGLSALSPKVPTSEHPPGYPSQFPGYPRQHLMKKLKQPYKLRKKTHG